VAVRSLGLDEIGGFDPDQKIIEYRVQTPGARLIDRTVQGFVDELSTDSPAPGGGSVAALCGALGGALAAMVSNLTVGKRKLQESWEVMRPVGDEGQAVKDRLLHLVDADTDAFNAVMAAMRLPKATSGEQETRDIAVQEATKEATLVPFRVLEASLEVLRLSRIAATHGNPNSASDSGVAALCARTCAEGAYLNVLINLPGIADRSWADELRQRAHRHCLEARRECDEVVTQVESQIAAQG
jgi:glutamate formiminotransferase/formiminotetrahydrofolate cyclodeaminase